MASQIWSIHSKVKSFEVFMINVFVKNVIKGYRLKAKFETGFHRWWNETINVMANCFLIVSGSRTYKIQLRTQIKFTYEFTFTIKCGKSNYIFELSSSSCPIIIVLHETSIKFQPPHTENKH